MKTKTIKTILRNKINDWIDSIDDPNVKIAVRENTIVTGGCIASMLLNEEVNDYDIYFKNKETTLAVALYYAHKFSERTGKPVEAKDLSKDPLFNHDGTKYQHLGGDIRLYIKSEGVAEDIEEFDPEVKPEHEGVIEETPEPAREELPKYSPVFISDNAISLTGRIQIVTRFYGEADEIHKNFDFIHCSNYWESYTGKLTIKKESLLALMNKDLVYTGSLFPICSIIRTRKFIKRGWNINAGQYLKMAFQISKLDLNQFHILKDQLIGVDAAYFNQVIDKLEEQGKDEIDDLYLIEVINRIFN